MSETRTVTKVIPNHHILKDEQDRITDVISFYGIQKITCNPGDKVEDTVYRVINNDKVVFEVRGMEGAEMARNFILWLESLQPKVHNTEVVGK